MDSRFVLLTLAVFASTLVLRSGHLDIVWVDEAYPLAAAARILGGETLYRDIWFDKPPLYAWVYLLWGGALGWPLRIAGALYVTLCAGLAAAIALRIFGRPEAWLAGFLAAFFLTFNHPVAALPLAPDLLSVAFVLSAVLAAVSGRMGLAGFLAGFAIHANAKALYVLPVVLVWQWRDWKRVMTGYATGVLSVLAVLWFQGALGGYITQVWRWGILYSGDSPFANPVGEGIRRTANWAGFHVALVAGAGVFWWRNRDYTAAKLAVWAVLALGSVTLGWRFFARYYFALLPVMVIAAASGWMTLRTRVRTALLVVLLTVPAARFGARHATLACEWAAGRPHEWHDLAMLNDSRAAAELVKGMARPGDRLFVWGYRPELNVLAGMPAANRFLDSQPLTGVLADRHLVAAEASMPEAAAANRRELLESKPEFIADGLGPYNPALAITSFPDLAAWLVDYELAGSTQGTRVYRLRNTR